MTGEKVTRYTCKHGHRKDIPGQPPLDPRPSIQTGCSECGYICEHRPVASIYQLGWLA
jgi:hypothetical protein